jgi:acyl-coenzyme A synthetase/AMP-(fatty) acid ligase
MNFVTIDKKIKQISEINPNKVAIEHKDEKVTYAELDRNSDIIANFLMNKYEENNNVFVLMEKSPRLIESMIGIIKSNGIFIPLDFNTPDNRILSMFNEVPAGWIITTTKFLEKINNICSLMGGIKLNILLIESFESVVYSNYSYLNIFSLYDEQKNSHKVQEYCQNKHCYIYFTSGSTGKPKAVLGRHKSLVQFIEWEIKEFKINSDFIGSQLINSGFDAFLRDVLVPLFAGGKICIPESQDIIFNPF